MSPTNYFGNDDVEPWTLAQIYADLCSRKDISKLLNVNAHRVNDWIRRGDIINAPRPITRIGHIDLYSRQEWRAWFQRWSEKHKDRPEYTTHAKVHGSGEQFWSHFDND